MKYVKFSNELREKAIDLRKEGKTYTGIAQILNVGKTTIERWVKHIKKPPTVLKCSKCKKDESKTSFYKKGKVCKSCQKIYKKNIMKIIDFTILKKLKGALGK